MNSGESRLLALGAPSQVGKLSAAEWSEIEQASGPLPPDFKRLISLFGYGSFGDLLLFHPLARREFNQLTGGERLAWQILRDERSEVLNDFLLRQPRILGRGPERHFLAHDEEGWWMLAWDVEEISPIGKDLGAFLHDAFTSLSTPEPHALARPMWKDNGPRAFFSPAHDLLGSMPK